VGLTRSRRQIDLPSRSTASSGHDPAYFEFILAAENKHFWFRTRNWIIFTLVRQIMADQGDRCRRILEVGCATGNVLRVLEQACPRGTIVGLDLLAEDLEYARRRTSCDLVRGDAENLPFCARFDLVGLFDVLEHLPEDNRVLLDLHALLRPCGVLVLTVPAHPSLWSYFDEVNQHRRRYAPSDLKDKLTRAGYSIEYLTQFNASIFPMVWVRRWLTMWIGRDSNNAASMRNMALSELRILPFVNELFAFLLAQEARLVARRHCLPIGTSLLAVARATIE
jgi:SAM-dependent methyltransferase